MLTQNYISAIVMVVNFKRELMIHFRSLRNESVSVRSTFKYLRDDPTIDMTLVEYLMPPF